MPRREVREIALRAFGSGFGPGFRYFESQEDRRDGEADQHQERVIETPRKVQDAPATKGAEYTAGITHRQQDAAGGAHVLGGIISTGSARVVVKRVTLTTPTRAIMTQLNGILA